MVDLSIGSPVDPVPGTVQAALAAAANSPGYPLTRGTPALRQAAANWLSRRHGVSVSPDTVLPVIGTKEFIAWLPTMLGLGPGDTVSYPALAYPTYDAGIRLAGATGLPADATQPPGPQPVKLAWVNSPSNPTGRVLPPEHLATMVAWARDRGTLLASDECYIEQGWETTPRSVLHPGVSGGSPDGLLAVHSLSKRSNLAGYRAGFVTGDPALIAELHEICRHAGLIVPAPIQAALTAALDDDQAADEQRSATAPAGPCSGPRWKRPDGWSSTPRPGCTYGPAAPDRTAGTRPASWPKWASWPRRASCTAPRACPASGWP